MFRIDRRLLQNVDWLLLVTAFGLVTISTVTLASLHVGRAGGSVVIRQLVWFAIGLVGHGACWPASTPGGSFAPRRRSISSGLAGAGRRLRAGPNRVGCAAMDRDGAHSPVQPSELFKLCFLLMMVWALTSRWAQPVGEAHPGHDDSADVAVPVVLIIKQPDLGTALLLVPVLVDLADRGRRALQDSGRPGPRGAGVDAARLAGAQGIPTRERILVFLDPFRDPLGSAYNVIQAKIAIGSGQLLGKGVAGATQSRLSFLPERHTDFIFAVFAEMWGFVGCLVLLLCYVLLLLRGFDIAATAREPVGRLVALGATSLFAAQVLDQRRDGDRASPCRRDSAAADELRWLLDGRLLHDDWPPRFRYECGSSNETRRTRRYGARSPCRRGAAVRKRIVVNAESHRNSGRSPGG